MMIMPTVGKEWTYKRNANAHGFVWVWDAKVGRYKLTHNGSLVGWFVSLKMVKQEIAELRFVAKGNLPKHLRIMGYSTSRELSGDSTPTIRLEFRGRYLGNYASLEEAEAAAKEHERNRWN